MARDIRYWLSMPHTSRQAIYGSIAVGSFALLLSTTGSDVTTYVALGVAFGLFVKAVSMDR